MIGYILFFIICLNNNEAHVDFNDDLDYASVSGMFIPINSNLIIRKSNDLTVRTPEDSMGNFFF